MATQESNRDLLLVRRNIALAARKLLVQEHIEMREKLSALTKRIGALENELHEIEALIATLDSIQANTTPTIMQAVLEVLQDRPDGLTALEILDEINSRYFGGSIVRTSLSPQLSRLKDRDKKIELVGNKWFLLPQEPTQFGRRF